MSVTIYSRSSCAPCKAVKHFLTRKGIVYEEKNLDDNPEYAQEAFSKSGYAMVPITIINDQVVAGMNLAAIANAIDI
jgi:glutaredoxin